MTSEYHVQTARTAKFPPFSVFDGHSEEERQPATYVPTANQYSNATGFLPHPTSSTTTADLLHAISIPDSYPKLRWATLVNPAPFRNPHRVTRYEIIPLPYETVGFNRLALRSSVTEPNSNTVTSVFSPNQNSTSAIASLIIVLGFANAIVAKEADEWMAKARDAARTGDLRAAYHGVYRGLDVLMKNAKWERVHAELEDICSDSYPVAFGIGAMRFASKAAESIPNWGVILKSLVLVAQRKKVDVRTAFRGLVDSDGAKSGFHDTVS